MTFKTELHWLSKRHLPLALIKRVHGKPNRKATELQEDTLLWAKLRAGTPINRNDKSKKDCANGKKVLLANAKIVKPSMSEKSIVLAEQFSL